MDSELEILAVWLKNKKTSYNALEIYGISTMFSGINGSVSATTQILSGM